MAYNDLSEKEGLENFDWDIISSTGIGSGYSKVEKNSISEMYENTISEMKEGEVLSGTIVGISNREVIVNIGFKSDGLVTISEFRDTPNIKIGDVIDVFVETKEDRSGQLVLSRKKAKLVSAWKNIQRALDEDIIVEALVKRRTKGGLIVDLFSVEAFLPGSQIDVKPIRDFDIYVGKVMEVKVVKINYTNDNVVVSHKVLIEKDIEDQKVVILNNLEKGQVLEGVIKNITNFGVFVDLGGVDGLLHITDISWGRINRPDEILSLDQKINVVVLDFDEEKKRISLGMKQLTPHPWEALPEGTAVGSKIKGKIVNVADYGAFLEIVTGIEGLIHVSEMSWSQHLRNPQDFIKVGDEIEAVVLTLDKDEHKMSLGIKQLTEDPWTNSKTFDKYAIGTKHSGVVRNLTNFGLFVELEEGIDGLIHVSDLSWTKKIKHPSEFIKLGESIDVIVLELDVENKRLALGHKQLEENPWDTFETVFYVGSNHQCTVVQKTDKSATLELPYGIEGFSSSKNIIKEDGKAAEVGENLTFKVVEFAKDERKIILSHFATYQEEEKKETPAGAAGPKKGGETKKAKKVETEVKPTTLGDNEVLSNLKEQMNSPETSKKAKAKKED